MIRCALLALACALCTSTSEPRMWRDVLDSSDVVVLAEVQELRDVPRGDERERVAVARVDRVVLGPADMEQALVVKQRGAERLEPGTRALLFLRRAGDLSDGEPLWSLAPDGRWHAADGAIVVPDALELVTEVGYGRRLAQDELLGWLTRAIARMTPTIDASLHSNAPFPWRVRVRPDGSWSERAASPLAETARGVLAPDELEALLDAIEGARLHEMPRRFGSFGGPWHDVALDRAADADGTHSHRQGRADGGRRRRDASLARVLRRRVGRAPRHGEEAMIRSALVALACALAPSPSDAAHVRRARCERRSSSSPRSAARMSPSIRAYHVTAGPFGWTLRVDRMAVWRRTSARAVSSGPTRWRWKCS